MEEEWFWGKFTYHRLTIANLIIKLSRRVSDSTFSFRLPPFVLTTNPFKIHNDIEINATEKRFNLTDIISYIGELVPSKTD